MDLDKEELFFTKNKEILNSAFEDLEIMITGLYSQCKDEEELEFIENHINGETYKLKLKRTKELERR